MVVVKDFGCDEVFEFECLRKVFVDDFKNVVNKMGVSYLFVVDEFIVLSCCVKVWRDGYVICVFILMSMIWEEGCGLFCYDVFLDIFMDVYFLIELVFEEIRDGILFYYKFLLNVKIEFDIVFVIFIDFFFYCVSIVLRFERF